MPTKTSRGRSATTSRSRPKVWPRSNEPVALGDLVGDVHVGDEADVFVGEGFDLHLETGSQKIADFFLPMFGRKPWIGEHLLRAGDVFFLELEKEDVTRAKQMLAYPWFAAKHWQEEISDLLAAGFKMEIEALSNKDISFVTDVYIPD